MGRANIGREAPRPSGADRSPRSLRLCARKDKQVSFGKATASNDTGEKVRASCGPSHTLEQWNKGRKVTSRAWTVACLVLASDTIFHRVPPETEGVGRQALVLAFKQQEQTARQQTRKRLLDDPLLGQTTH